MVKPTSATHWRTQFPQRIPKSLPEFLFTINSISCGEIPNSSIIRINILIPSWGGGWWTCPKSVDRIVCSGPTFLTIWTISFGSFLNHMGIMESKVCSIYAPIWASPFCAETVAFTIYSGWLIKILFTPTSRASFTSGTISLMERCLVARIISPHTRFFGLGGALCVI